MRGQMRVAVYSCTDLEEKQLRHYAAGKSVQLKFTKEPISVANTDVSKGCLCCIVNHSTDITDEVLDALYEKGVRYVSTRTVGYDHIDMEHAVKIGMCVGNTSYSPGSVAEYTLMEILMAVRNMGQLEQEVRHGNFGLPESPGREMQDITIGVLGTGSIGGQLIHLLSGFGSRILAYDLFQNPDLEQYVQYADLNTVLSQSDILTLHMPANKLTFHMLNKETIKHMKQGAYVINTGRGSLIDTTALIEALEAKKLSGAALDVLEGEKQLFSGEKTEKDTEQQIAALQKMENVTITPHVAFYTSRAVRDMVCNALDNCIRYEKNTAESRMCG